MSRERKLFYLNYDMDASTYKYGRLWGPIPGYGLAKSSAGTSTTVVATATGVGTFAPLKAGDVIRFRTGEGTFARRKVVTPGNDSIVVDLTIDLGTAGVPWAFYSWAIGATGADGWHYVHNYMPPYTLLIDAATVAAAGGIDFQVEGLGEHEATPIILLPTVNIAAAGSQARTISEKVLKLRVGVKGQAGFAGTDDFSVAMEGEPYQ